MNSENAHYIHDARSAHSQKWEHIQKQKYEVVLSVFKVLQQNCDPLSNVLENMFSKMTPHFLGVFGSFNFNICDEFYASFFRSFRLIYSPCRFAQKPVDLGRIFAMLL